MDEIWAVVPAAGEGSRLSASLPKQYLELNGRCLLQRTVDTLIHVQGVAGVVVVLASDDAYWATLPASKYKRVKTCVGGATRAESVLSGLLKVTEQDTSENVMALVHDAARALTSVADIERLIKLVADAPEQGGLLAVPVQDTLKRAGPTPTASLDTHVEITINRANLWQAQTPQLFRAASLRDALQANPDAIDSGAITDEASAMELAGYKPLLVEALQPNFKITRAVDLELAKALVGASESRSDSP